MSEQHSAENIANLLPTDMLDCRGFQLVLAQGPPFRLSSSLRPTVRVVACGCVCVWGGVSYLLMRYLGMVIYAQSVWLGTVVERASLMSFSGASLALYLFFMYASVEKPL